MSYTKEQLSLIKNTFESLVAFKKVKKCTIPQIISYNFSFLDGIIGGSFAFKQSRLDLDFDNSDIDIFYEYSEEKINRIHEVAKNLKWTKTDEYEHSTSFFTEYIFENEIFQFIGTKMCKPEVYTCFTSDLDCLRCFISIKNSYLYSSFSDVFSNPVEYYQILQIIYNNKNKSDHLSSISKINARRDKYLYRGVKDDKTYSFLLNFFKLSGDLTSSDIEDLKNKEFLDKLKECCPFRY